MMEKTESKMTTRELSMTAMLIAMIAIGAWITLPIGLVSVTMQTLFVMLAGLVLPRRSAVMAVGGYLLLGLLGLPIFAGGTGGPAILAKPSFGFLIGFLPLALISSLASGSTWKKGVVLLVANLVLYSFGFAYMYAYFHFFSPNPMAVSQILQIGILPYLPGDAIKIVLAITLAKISVNTGFNSDRRGGAK